MPFLEVIYISFSPVSSCVDPLGWLHRIHHQNVAGSRSIRLEFPSPQYFWDWLGPVYPEVEATKQTGKQEDLNESCVWVGQLDFMHKLECTNIYIVQRRELANEWVLTSIFHLTSAITYSSHILKVLHLTLNWFILLSAKHTLFSLVLLLIMLRDFSSAY